MRWVDECYLIHEDVVGLIEVQSTDGATLASLIKDALLRCQRELGCCRGQAYDAASNMSGCFKGVASRLTNEEPTVCMYTVVHIAAYKIVVTSVHAL